jgi:hypothetical protein
MIASSLNAIQAAEMNLLQTVNGYNRPEDIRDELQIFSTA